MAREDDEVLEEKLLENKSSRDLNGEEERRLLETLLSESETSFRDVSDRSDNLIWYVLSRPENVFYVNKVFTTIWGISREELYKNPRLWLTLIHKDDRADVEKKFDSWLSSGSVGKYMTEYRVINVGGPVHWVRDVVTAILNKDGTLRGTLGIGDHGILEKERVNLTEALEHDLL